MKKKRIVWVLLVLVVVVAVGVLLLNGQGSGNVAYAQEHAQTQTITTYYSFSGNVVVKDSEELTAGSSATVRDIYVEKGDRVQKDDRLIRLSDGETLKAGIAGEVASLPVKEDEDVKAGAVLISIVDFDDLEIEIKVDEYDVSAVEVGKEATVTIDALGNSFTSTVTDFDRQANLSSNTTYYLATLDVGQIDGILPGMQVDVKILKDHAENVTAISMNALKFDEYNQPYVLVADEKGKAVQTPVEVGVNDGVYVEIKSGLKTGDEVLVEPRAASFGMMMRAGGA